MVGQVRGSRHRDNYNEREGRSLEEPHMSHLECPLIVMQEQRLSDYLRAMTFKLTPKEIKEIKELGEKKNFRGFWRNKYAADDYS